MKVSLIIPSLNEEESLPYVLKEVDRSVVDEILVVDGHSTDKTRELAQAAGARVLLQPARGFGDALKFGFQKAAGDVVVIMDADGSQNPADIRRLVEKLDQGYDMVLGSRYLPGARSDDDTLIRKLGNRFFTFLTNLLFGSNFSDSLYLFAAVKRDKLLGLDLKSDDFALCIEIIARGWRAGFKITEIPCVERPRIAGGSRVNAFVDGLKILFQMFKWL